MLTTDDKAYLSPMGGVNIPRQVTDKLGITGKAVTFYAAVANNGRDIVLRQERLTLAARIEEIIGELEELENNNPPFTVYNQMLHIILDGLEAFENR